MTDHATDSRDDSARRGDGAAARGRPLRSIRASESRPIRDATDRVLAQDVVSAVDVPPFDRAAMDGYAVIAEDTFGAGAYDAAERSTCIETVYTGQVPSRGVDPRRVHRDRDRRADAGGRRRGRDGRGDRESAAADVRVVHAVYPRQHVGRRGADIAAGQTVLARGDSSEPEPDRRARRHRRDRDRRLREAARRDPLDRQRDRRARTAARARDRSTTSTAHAVARSSRARRRRGGLPTAPDTPDGSRRGDRRRRGARRHRVFRRQLRRRARPDPRRAAAARAR